MATYLKQVYKFIVCKGQTLCIFSATKYLIYSIDSYFSYDKTGFDLLHGMGCSRNFDFCSNLLKIYVKVGWFEGTGPLGLPKSVLRFVVDKVKLFVPN